MVVCKVALQEVKSYYIYACSKYMTHRDIFAGR